jgi:hypothetical protein
VFVCFFTGIGLVVIVEILPFMLNVISPISVITGVCKNRVGGKHQRGFVNVEVSGVLRVIGDCCRSLLFFVVETFPAFPCIMARFLAISTRGGIAIARRA